ncbi:hypothetical protein [Anaerosalibacter massiliensis]|uniref:Uncharacterized protein n=1 Tax=Anaerosalibacter massiliensis TaxID=1347392 RepID=A0A9X2MIG5_9FIRM|nr:hypothetical protein [Anaerosalibacter massiliensis]MCR2044643.1 hypothetical protein [Anaerosalibacter massiliensis]
MAFLAIESIVTSFVSSVLWGMGFVLKEEMDIGVTKLIGLLQSLYGYNL